MEFQPNDFKSMLFPVWAIKSYTGGIVDLYPELAKYPEFKLTTESVNPIKCFKYINLVYDRKSPLNLISDIFKRKYEAMNLSSFDKNKKGEINQEYLDVADCKNLSCNIWIMWLLRMQSNESWSQFCKYQDMFYKELSELEGYDNPQDRIAGGKLVAEFRKILTELKDEFTIGDSNNSNLNQFISNYRHFEPLDLTVEALVKSFNENNDRTLQWSIYNK